MKQPPAIGFEWPVSPTCVARIACGNGMENPSPIGTALAAVLNSTSTQDDKGTLSKGKLPIVCIRMEQRSFLCRETSDVPILRAVTFHGVEP